MKDWMAAFLTGRVFRQYREQVSNKSRMLADFIIGAHASVCGYGLISRDRDYGRFFHVEWFDTSKKLDS
ncbi:MAG: hypothetical protein H7833_09200 [Magnetococcus sp. DMHC-1]|nr:hypothetical protein [Magnetococcales bacterium]